LFPKNEKKKASYHPEEPKDQNILQCQNLTRFTNCSLVK
jgi:hypothetical protein